MTDYDAIVIGSGSTGGWAAKELTERGLTTLVLEAGRPIDPARDYAEHVPTWKTRFRMLGDRKHEEANQAVQRNAAGFDELSSRFYVNDKDNPYRTDEGKPFRWVRGRQVGGRSLTWGRQSYRFSDVDFEANAREGVGIDWPLRYADLAPWYDHVEDFIGVSGQAEGLAHLPDGHFLPPMELNPAEALARERIAAQFGGERRLTIGRVAVLTRAHRGRAACHACGPCQRGCITGSYFSSISSTLPAAMATRRLTLRPHSVVHSLIFDAHDRVVRGVRVIDAVNKKAIEYRARVVFLCASTLESTRILLNSATREFPQGLANSSGQLGHNLMDHVSDAGAFGDLQVPGDDPEPHRPNGVLIPRFRNLAKKHPDFVRGYMFLGGAQRLGWQRPSTGFGPALKRDLLKQGPWGFGLIGGGECLPYFDNHVTIDSGHVDAWGIPTLKIHCTFRANELAMRKEMAVTAAEILEAIGVRGAVPVVEDGPPGNAIHEMGTARMGRDAKTSVLNGHNQAHDVKNLFVTDGAAMTSSSCVNPGLTYMALTARASAWAVELLKRGEI